MGVLGAPAQTTRAAVVGDPVAHSFSPAIHVAAYRALGLEWGYEAIRIASGGAAAAIEEAARLGWRGLSVTTPLKVEAAAACHQRAAIVERVGAANTVVFSDRPGADNTDGSGLLDDLVEAFGFVAEGATCAVIGSGAAARAVIVALSDAGARRLLVVARDRKRAAEVAALAGAAGEVAPEAALREASLVVQASALSFGGDRADEELGRRLGGEVARGELVVDCVYAPARTPFLEEAERHGAVVRNGLGMLVHQAARQVELFTGERAPLGAMWAAVGGRGT